MDIGVIFDSDGVVVDSEHHSLQSFTDAMADQGITLTPEDMHDCCGLTDESIIRKIEEKYKKSVDLERFRALKFDLYFSLIDKHGLEVYPGVKELLDQLNKEGIPYTLASSGPWKKIKFNLTRVGLLDRFPHIISGEDVVESKPAPYIFLKAAELIDRDPSRCVVIEDSPNGLLGARRAGMKTIAVRTTFQDDTVFINADLIVDSLQDITLTHIHNLLSSNS
jgi:HAD superfamily hydrolase (TIGR01509 family)